jgi:proteasome accessory factor B
MRTASRPPLARLAAIDQAIRAGGWPNAASLARQLEVNPRTVQRDLAFLRDRLQAPLAFDPVRNGYAYTRADFRLPFFRVTEGELVALFLAERLLRQYRGTPFEADLGRAFRRLTGPLAAEVTLDLAAVADALSVTPTAQTPQDAATFRTLAEAVTRRQRLDLVYFTAERGEVTRRRVDPYHLTLVDSDWYLIAHCHRRGEVLLFAAARVREAHPTGEPFARPADFRVEEYLGRSFRACRGPGCYRVAVRFVAAAAARAGEKVWHHTQTAERLADGGLVIRLEVSDLREIRRWILGWGADCEVLEPEELRAAVAAELRRTLAQYGQGGGV